jgi:putative transposase
VGTKYPAIARLWPSAWEEFIPFLDYDSEIRAVLCSTRSSRSTPATDARCGPAGTSRPNRPR